MKWKVITDCPDGDLEEKWHEFMPLSSYPSHYTSPGFFKMAYWENKNPFAVLVMDADKVVGVSCGLLGDIQVVSGMEVCPQVSFSKRADKKQIAQAMLDGLVEFGGNEIELITLHSQDEISAFEELGFGVKKAEGSFEVVVLDLSVGGEEIFKGFSQSRRSDIRKALRQEKLQISQLETLEELEELHTIHVNWCNVKDLAPDHWEMFKTAWEQKDYMRIFVAKSGGKIIAGSYFRFYKNALVEYAANNSIPEYQNLRPNDLLVWKAIEWSCENGFSKFGMGGSHLFLRRFGGEVVSSYRYQMYRTFFKKHAAKEALSNLAVKTYQNLPDSAREKIKTVFKR